MASPVNIIDTAIRCGIFQTFARLLEGSQLERELRSETSYTLFAPADIAFAYLQAKIFDQLLRAENAGRLAHVLSYHVVREKIMSGQLKDLARAKNIYGAYLKISNTHELRIDGVRLLHTDIEARNGVIHAIDGILLPATTSAASDLP